MGMREICSYSSYWRGLEYFENNRVKSINKINEYEYEAEVEWTENNHVHLNIKRPIFIDAYKKNEITKEEFNVIEERVAKKIGLNPNSVYIYKAKDIKI